MKGQKMSCFTRGRNRGREAAGHQWGHAGVSTRNPAQAWGSPALHQFSDPGCLNHRRGTIITSRDRGPQRVAWSRNQRLSFGLCLNSPQGFGHTGVWEPLSFNKDRNRIERQVENPWEGVSGARSSQALQGCECVWGVTIIQPFFHSTSLYEKTYPIPGMAPKNAGTVVCEQEGHSSCVQEVRSGKCHQARATSYIPECLCGTPEAHRNPPDP